MGANLIFCWASSILSQIGAKKKCKKTWEHSPLYLPEHNAPQSPCTQLLTPLLP